MNFSLDRIVTMRLPVMTTRGLMVVIAGFGAASAVAVYQSGILLVGILPTIGEIHRASRLLANCQAKA